MVSAGLTVAVVAGIAVVAAALDAPGRAEPLPPPSPLPQPAQTFTSADDLREFARAAYADLSRGDWASLGRSFVPGGAPAAGPCEPEGEQARTEVWWAALEAEAALRESPLHAQLVELPRLEWSVAAVDVGEGEAWVARRAGAFGRAIEPSVLRRDRWMVVGDAWWLDPASLLGDLEGRGAPPPGVLPECREGSPEEVPPPGTFANPLPDGTRADAAIDGRPLAITMRAGRRGEGPPAPDGFEYAPFEARVESRDGSQLGSPLAFRPATFDGWLLGPPISTATDICPGTEATGVTCQLTRGRALVSVDDPAPRIAWTPSWADLQGVPAEAVEKGHEYASPEADAGTLALPDRAAGAVWWRLPPLHENGEPVVRAADPNVAEALADAGVDTGAWKTDFSRMTVDPAELLAAGGARGPTALDLPGAEESPGVYDSVAEADAWLGDAEPILTAEAGEEARAYPLRFLIWHPVVNDVLGGEPVLVTYSALTNTPLAFSRRVGTWAPSFHPAGAVRFGNLLLYDDATESWRQQGTGEAVAGELAGHRLSPMPALLISWADFKHARPDGSVLSINAGFAGEYDFNPHFDTDFNPPSSLRGGELDARLPAHARVLGLRAGGIALAVPFAEVGRSGVAQFEFEGAPVVVFWRRGTASALSHIDIAQGRDVGAAAAFDPRVGGRSLTLTEESGVFTDAETGSDWDITGRAVSGPLAGERLRPLTQTNSYWYGWAALNPGTDVWRTEG